MSTETKTDKPPTQPATDADLLRKVAMLESQLEVRERQLKQALDYHERHKAEDLAKEDAEKKRLIDSIQLDSKFTKEDLAPKSLSDLQTMRTTLDKSIEKTFVSVAAEIDEAKRKKTPQLTVGYWNSKKQEWTGGI